MAIRPIELPGWMNDPGPLENLAEQELSGANDTDVDGSDDLLQTCQRRNLSLYVLNCPGTGRTRLFVQEGGFTYQMDSPNSRYFQGDGIVTIYQQIPLRLQQRGFQAGSEDLVLDVGSQLEDLGYHVELRDQQMPTIPNEQWCRPPNTR